MSVVAIVKLTAKSGLGSALLDALQPAATLTGEQPACLSIELIRGVENPDDILLLERWESVEDHENFINGVIAAGGLAEIMKLLAGDIETSHYR